MADTIRPMLPPLHEAHRVPPLPKAGTWHPMGFSRPASGHGRGLNTGPRLTEAAGDIVSIPDVWAQVTVFANALESDGHPLHRRSVPNGVDCLVASHWQRTVVPDLTSELVSVRPGSGGSAWAQLAGRLTPQCSLLDSGRITEVPLCGQAGRSSLWASR